MRAGRWYKYRSTFDKLDEHLNHIAESGDTVVSIHHVGGRDWVLICRVGQPRGALAAAVTAGARSGAADGRVL